MLLLAPSRAERDLIEAIAWLQLAADQGWKDAQTVLESEYAKFGPSQFNWIKDLKNQLAH